MTTEPEAIPADVLELARAASWEGTLPKEVCAYEIAHAIMADRASRAPVDGAGLRPIETAPKDGTVIDLFARGERWTDCRWGAPEHCCGEAGQYCDSDWHGSPEGWVWTTMNEFLPSEEPPTHWMPLPAAPGTHPAPASPDAEMVVSETTDVRVKALEWREHKGDEFCFVHYDADAIGGSYTVEARKSGDFDLWLPNQAEASRHANLDQAKAAAQADYERRILAALEPAAKPKYSARDAFLSLTDGSNWPEMKGDYFSGYQDAMEQVHQHVMDFWPELSATDLPEPSPKPAGGEWVTVPTEPTKEMVWAFWNASGPDAERYRAMLAAAPPAPAASPPGGEVGVGDRELLQALSRLAGNRHSDGTSSLVSSEDRSAIINGCHDLMVASRATSPEAPQASEVVRELIRQAGDLATTAIRRMRAAHVDCRDLTMDCEQLLRALAKIGGDHE